MEYQHITHGFEPVYDKNSGVLILGSLPSVKSREAGFYYGHPQNRFWSVVSQLCGEPLPKDTEEKKDILLRHGIALWDVIYECDIKGSDDASIRNAVPTDISSLLAATEIERVYVNGKTAKRIYDRYQFKTTGKQAYVLPSTSPANAACRMEELVSRWGVIKDLLVNVKEQQ